MGQTIPNGPPDCGSECTDSSCSCPAVLGSKISLNGAIGDTGAAAIAQSSPLGQASKKCPSSGQKIGKTGTTTTQIGLKSDASTFSVNSSGSECLSIPLKDGGSLSLAWYRLSGENLGNTDDCWPAGFGALFAFLPSMGLVNQPFSNVIWEERIPSGVLTYGTTGAPNAEIPRIAIDSTTYITTYEERQGTYFEYFKGVQYTDNAGRLNRKYDSHGKELLNQNQLLATGSLNMLLPVAIGGSLMGQVVPYFEYAGTSPTNFQMQKIYLLDLASPSSSRTIYFTYSGTPTFPVLSSIVNPVNCIVQYNSVGVGVYGSRGNNLNSEVDAEGYTTYYEYEPILTDTPPLKRVIEPEGRVTYFQYPAVGVTLKMPVGRGATYFNYNLSSLHDELALPTLQTDPLGNLTQWGYDVTLSQVTCRVNANGDLTYFEYVGGSAPNLYAVTRMLRTTSGAQTYFGYNGTTYDLSKVVGPRHTSTFNVTTYYEYNSSRDRTTVVDALGNKTQTGYDGFGQNLRVQDARGNVTYFNYGSATGHLDSAVMADGTIAYYGYNSFRNKLREVSPRWTEQSFAAFTTYYEYDQLSRMTKRVDPLLNVTYYDWTARSLPLDTVDARGTTTAFTYNGLKLMTQRTVTDKGGSQLTQEKYGYDVYKNKTATLDARLNATYFYYDQLDRMTAQVDALQDATYYFYDSVGNQTVQKDARGNPAYYFYDLLSRNTARRDAQGNATYFFYDLADNRNLAVDARGNPTYFFYDQLDRLQAARDALANPTYYFYDPVSNRSIVSDARFNSVYYFYDVDNRNNVTRDALGNVTYFAFNADSQTTKMVDARGDVTLIFYDTLDRKSILLDALSDATYFGYDSVGNTIQSMDARFNATYYFYDGLKRNTVVRNALGDLTYYFYDPTSNRTALRNPNVHTTYFGYDAINRPTRAQDALGNTTYYEFDPVGNPTKILDPDLHAILTQFDSLNRPSAMRFADSGSPYFFYDASSNRIKDVDPLGKATYYGYDALNRGIRYADALFRTIYFEYDPVSNLSKQVGGEGESSTYTYDAINRRTNIAFTAAGAVVSASISSAPYFIYDQVSNMTQMGDLWGLHRMGYDANNRLARHQFPNQNVVYYEYDPAWNTTTVVYPGTSGRSGAGYDAVNRQIRVQAPSGSTAYFAYDPASNLSQRLYGSGVKLVAGYDACERVQSWRNASSGGAALSYFDYARDAKGLITKAVRESNYTVYYNYDANDRLASEVWAKTGATPSEVYGYRYAYDLAGNRTKSVVNGANTYYFYDQANQLTVSGSTSAFATPTYYIYDKNGALTNLVEPTGATYFAYNTAGLVAQIRWKDASVTYFFYDGALRRYGMNAFGSMTYFLWDGPNLLQELNLDGTVKEEYTNARTAIPGIGQLLEINRPGQTPQKIYPVMDPRGTVTKQLQSDGVTVQAAKEYDAFGNIIPNSATGTWIGRFTYQGQSWLEITSSDASKRLLLSPTRIYDPVTGRFLQRDPLRPGDVTFDGMNLYSYVGSVPLHAVDPTGLVCAANIPIQGQWVTEFQDRWSLSFPGGPVSEQGGSLIDTGGAGGVVARPGPAGQPGMYPPGNFPVPGPREIMIGTYHTHPYASGRMGAPHSEDDILFLRQQRHGNQVWVYSGTCIFALTIDDANACNTCTPAQIRQTYEDARTGTLRRIAPGRGSTDAERNQALEAAIVAVANACGMCFYRVCRDADGAWPTPMQGTLQR